MQLPMMLITSYNLSLSFCQLVVDLLCLGFLCCIHIVPMVINLFFRGFRTILQLGCVLVTFRSKVSKWLYKMWYQVSFLNFFYTKQSVSSNHPFRKVILLEASIQLNFYATVQVARVFDLVFLHIIRPWDFRFPHFSYLLPHFSNLIMYVILYCQLSQFIFRIPK